MPPCLCLPSCPRGAVGTRWTNRARPKGSHDPVSRPLRAGGRVLLGAGWVVGWLLLLRRRGGPLAVAAGGPLAVAAGVAALPPSSSSSSSSSRFLPSLSPPPPHGPTPPPRSAPPRDKPPRAGERSGTHAATPRERRARRARTKPKPQTQASASAAARRAGERAWRTRARATRGGGASKRSARGKQARAAVERAPPGSVEKLVAELAQKTPI